MFTWCQAHISRWEENLQVRLQKKKDEKKKKVREWVSLFDSYRIVRHFAVNYPVRVWLEWWFAWDSGITSSHLGKSTFVKIFKHLDLFFFLRKVDYFHKKKKKKKETRKKKANKKLLFNTQFCWVSFESKSLSVSSILHVQNLCL